MLYDHSLTKIPSVVEHTPIVENPPIPDYAPPEPEWPREPPPPSLGLKESLICPFH